MELILKDGKLWTKKYLSEELVDVTSEGEKYLFKTNIDVSSAIVGDFFKVLNSNNHLKEIFGVRPTKKYENVDSLCDRLKNILTSKGVISEFLDFYREKSDEEIRQSIQNSSVISSFVFELEVISEYDENGLFVGKFIDFVGVENENRYSMSLSPIDSYFFTPIKIEFYKSFYDTNDEKVLEKSKGEMKTYEFFNKFAENLAEMVLEKNVKLI